MSELEKCPFCGGDAELCSVSYMSLEDSTFWVRCNNCFAQTNTVRNKKDAAKLWNRRATDNAGEV